MGHYKINRTWLEIIIQDERKIEKRIKLYVQLSKTKRILRMKKSSSKDYCRLKQ